MNNSDKNVQTENAQTENAQTNIVKKRGRKSSVNMPEPEQHVVLPQHHFKYSDDFSQKLSAFATEHLEDKNKAFKMAWIVWKNDNSDLVKTEIANMTHAGYQGSVEEKMYFSARYYYRKRAIREQQTPEENTVSSPRKKYESIDKEILTQMSNHILSQIYKGDTVEGQLISKSTPSKSYEDYCSKYELETDDAQKKNYKNLYWRISKKMKQ